MRKLRNFLLVVLGLIVIVVVANFLLTPWMDRWGATQAEIVATFPGDELVPNPAVFVNRAVTINADPEQIYPWLVQIGAERGGYYSYAWLETNLLRCPMVNADSIHAEWQGLKPGDEVKMCPGEFGPPPYTVARLDLNRAVVLGHQENGKWVEVWQFIIVPQSDHSSRLVLRSRSALSGGIWSVIHPGIFIMERGMLSGIKERAEGLQSQAIRQ